MAMPSRPFHLAAISLVLIALLLRATAAEASTSTSLQPRASALPMGSPSPRDAPPSATTGRLHASPAARIHEDQEDAAAPSPLAAPPTTRPAHRAWYEHYGVTLADLRSVCQAPRCFTDSDHRLLSVLYGPHIRIRSSGKERYGYGVARTIEGTQPILPFSSWRAYVYSGGDVCHVEIGYMELGTFLGAGCPDWTCQSEFTLWPDEALAWALSAIATPCGGGGGTSSAATAASPPNAVALLSLLAAAAGFLPPPLAAAVALSSLAPTIFPWRNTWRAHLPVADPGAAAFSGDRLCYVELAHMDYREAYYIRCPAAGGHAHVSCTEFPDEVVAAAVWEHRSLTYRDTVGPKCERYRYGAAGHQIWGYDYNADL
ncbi:unnamed protein product [Urochloa decumbens]|uniref:Uncharacterized protein n=1 Tax=Urochloa decumbens TaxID=240449 RepID=A0ABC9BQP0_9POAL